MSTRTLELWSRIYPHFGDSEELYSAAADWVSEQTDDELLVLYRPAPLEDLPSEDVRRVEPVRLRGEGDLPESPDIEAVRGAGRGLLSEDHYLRHLAVRGRWYGAFEGPGDPPEVLEDVLGTLAEFIDLGADYHHLRQRSGTSQWLIETGEILETSRNPEDVLDRLFELVCCRLDVSEAGYYALSGSRYQLARSYGFEVPDGEEDPRGRAVVTLDRLRELGLGERKVLVRESPDDVTVNVYLPLELDNRDLGLVVLYDYPIPEDGLSDLDRFVMSSLSTLCTITLDTMKVHARGERHAIEDDLTSLKTARYFQHQLDLEIERGERYGLPCSILVVEVENHDEVFKAHGPGTVREVMRKLGNIIRQNFRRIDVGGRLSDDEVAILYPNTNLEEAMISSSRLVRLVEDPFLTGTREVSVSIRGGVAGYPGDGTEAAELIKKARLALYEARQKEEDRILSTDELEGAEA